MNVFLWIVQAFLAASFTVSGLIKATRPKDRLRGMFPWVEDFSQATVRFIGVMGLLGGIGMILPAVTGIATVLTPLAGVGIAVLMVLAAAVHVRREESSAIMVNAILFVLAAFVAWGRFGPYGW
ncbi:DoxX family protein [Actinopolymorpha alba]|uniref:DoxX family protein n=1 Tax=Actinopolymorpha alba TaxID=533267 RepID=UPI000365BAA7|nr:DoxX family protein [Actinopolymorpha alba]